MSYQKYSLNKDPMNITYLTTINVLLKTSKNKLIKYLCDFRTVFQLFMKNIFQKNIKIVFCFAKRIYLCGRFLNNASD